MTTATAAKPSKTEKYPGWSISKTGPAAYTMTRPGGVFAISVTHSVAYGYEGTLMTRQTGGWAPAKTPYRFSVIGCVAEADRRESHIAKYAAMPLAKLTRTTK